MSRLIIKSFLGLKCEKKSNHERTKFLWTHPASHLHKALFANSSHQRLLHRLPMENRNLLHILKFSVRWECKFSDRRHTVHDVWRCTFPCKARSEWFWSSFSGVYRLVLEVIHSQWIPNQWKLQPHRARCLCWPIVLAVHFRQKWISLPFW